MLARAGGRVLPFSSCLGVFPLCLQRPVYTLVTRSLVSLFPSSSASCPSYDIPNHRSSPPRRTDYLRGNGRMADVLHFLWSYSLSALSGLATISFAVTFANARKSSDSISGRFSQRTKPKSECGRLTRYPDPTHVRTPTTDIGISKGDGCSNSTSSNRRRGNRVDSALLLSSSASRFSSYFFFPRL
ncbi:hypothetical protein DFH94DRAFT_707483, partial [Russula ochroleuca]